MFVLVKRILIRGAIVAAVFLLLGALTLPRLGAWLVVEDPLQKADAIIVLGGTLYERPLEAVELYKDGWAPRVFLIRELSDWGEALLKERGIPHTSEVDLQIDVIQRLGVPRDAIGVVEPANSTAEESGHVRALVAREKFSRVIVITSKQHTRRARLVFNRRLGPAGVTVIMRATRYDRADVNRWWANRSTLRFTLFETQRLFAYWIGIAD
jgi:uncharacterized SAM-binding protein YcdF (DUF218 family)